jgi:enoyl-CoA hydratase
MTNTDKIQLTIDADGIAILTFNRPDALNALDLAAMAAFAAQVAALVANDRVRVVIVTGAGKSAFCSGGDLYELSQLTTEEQARDFITLMGDALFKLEHLPVPVIAAINGYALGGGSEIALACDMRYADEKVRMGFVQIRLALTPGWGAGQRLMRVVGYAKAMDLLLHGHVMRAKELQALGLANKIVDEGIALDHALYFARHIVQHPPDAVRGVKALLRAGREQPYIEALQTERDIFPPLWAAKPHLDAVEDFLKRKGQS